MTKEAKDFVRKNSGLNQYVTEESDSSEDVSENIRNRNLLMDLVSVAQSLGHLPDEDEIEANSNYSADRFRDEFGGLFKACQEAGIVPDYVTKEDYTEVTEAKKEQEDAESGDEESESEPSGPSEAELIEELQWVDEEVEGIPYPADMNESGAFSAHDYQEAFGSWDDALDAAGIDKEEQLLEDMRLVAKPD
ncbi:homing endonuclease associated repeat-containing protein [Haloarcula sp. NS06]|uniref:homing endonuclease associated repeat-containing protein n=1 Tax=Haloarcula sp. NS06 TaxID=3409688 RepID=UPI003DA7576A